MRKLRFAMAILPFFSGIPLAWADAFVLNNGVFTTFNVPGATPGSTVATGVNDSGQIVGYFNNSTGRHGFLDTNGVFTAIDFPSAALTDASGINNAGAIVGGFQSSLGELPQGFLDTNGIFSVLPLLGAGGVNSSGEIVGTIGTPGITTETAAIYNNGSLTPLSLPFAKLASSEGSGINGAGQIVGVYFTSSNGTFVAHGFLDSNGAFSSIDAPSATGTYAYGINSSGQIVGFEQTGSQLTIQAFLDVNGTFTAFQVPGGSNTVAYDINDSGQIVGSFSPATVPEPTSLVLLPVGLAFFRALAKLKLLEANRR